MHSSNTTSVFHLLTPFICDISIERDAQLLANRIALLKQEEMKTWKKIEETKKRTNDITNLKKRNEEKVQKVCTTEQTNQFELDGTPILQFDFIPYLFRDFSSIVITVDQWCIRATYMMIMITFVVLT